jgi:hypothetical protein
VVSGVSAAPRVIDRLLFLEASRSPLSFVIRSTAERESPGSISDLIESVVESDLVLELIRLLVWLLLKYDLSRVKTTDLVGTAFNRNVALIGSLTQIDARARAVAGETERVLAARVVVREQPEAVTWRGVLTVALRAVPARQRSVSVDARIRVSVSRRAIVPACKRASRQQKSQY